MSAKSPCGHVHVPEWLHLCMAPHICCAVVRAAILRAPGCVWCDGVHKQGVVRATLFIDVLQGAFGDRSTPTPYLPTLSFTDFTGGCNPACNCMCDAMDTSSVITHWH